MEYIEKVKLNLDYYKGKDLYSDGNSIEDELLEICKSGKIKEALRNSNKWPILYHLSDIRGNIIDWYPFKKKAHILEIGSGCGAVSGFLCQRAERVVGVELSKKRSLINAYRNHNCDNLEIVVGNFKDIELDEKFDYITLIGVFEYAVSYIGGESPYVNMLKKIKKFLKEDGKIIIAIENKMGLKYWNGANEDHVGRRFEGIENYRFSSKVRTFSKPELKKIFNESGIDTYRFYYPLPDYKLPLVIYSDEYLPHMGEVRTWGTNYNSPRIGLFNEAIVADQICKDRLFDYFSNSFLIICNEKYNDVKFACYSNGQRIEDYQMRTLIIKSERKEIAIKSFLKKRNDTSIFDRMKDSYETLKEEFPNLEFVKPDINNGELIYDYIDGIPLDVVLAKNVNNFKCLVEKFRKIIDTYMLCKEEILQEFIVTEKYISFFGNNVVRTREKSLIITNLDMQLSNLILKGEKVYCIDYEWLIDFPVPFEFVIYRCINNFWIKFNMYLSSVTNLKDFLIELGIKEENIEIYREMAKMFSNKIFGIGVESHYLQNYRKQSGVIEWRNC